MTNKSKSKISGMEEQIFLSNLAECIISTISDKKYNNLKTRIIQEGHFNGRVHSYTQMSNMITRKMCRYLMNIAMMIPAEDFKGMMMRLIDEFLKVIDCEIADIINQSHARKKKKKD